MVDILPWLCKILNKKSSGDDPLLFYFELFTNDVRHDALLLGHATKQLVSEAWEHGGQSHAFKLIESINQDEHLMQIRWVWLDAGPDDPFAPRFSPVELDAVNGEQDALVKETSKNKFGYFYTYVPIDHQDTTNWRRRSFRRSRSGRAR
jgi:hypothetical protein